MRVGHVVGLRLASVLGKGGIGSPVVRVVRVHSLSARSGTHSDEPLNEKRPNSPSLCGVNSLLRRCGHNTGSSCAGGGGTRWERHPLWGGTALCALQAPAEGVG